MAVRPIAGGSIAFGLVSIPVKLFPSQHSSAAIRFNRLHEVCGTRLKQQNYCPQCDVVVARDDMVKGYEFAKGQYVRFTEEELKAVEAQSTGGIDIVEFVPIDQIDPVYFDKAYYLGPDKGAARAYHLLAEAMRSTGLCAVAKYAARGKSYLVMLRPTEEGIILQQLYHEFELRAFTDVEVEEAEVKDTELQLAVQLIQQAAAESFQPDKYVDEVRTKIEAMIAGKVEGEEIITTPTESPKSQVIDLMSALKASLAGEAGGASEAAGDEGDRKRPKRVAASAKTKSAKKAEGE
jgi:DNA end-binding protein Ku